MSTRVGVIAVLRAKPGMEREMRARAREMQEVSSAEPGCVSYRNYVDPEDPRSWVVVEEWEDRAALDAHLASPHLARSLELSATLLDGPPSVRIFTETE